VKAIRLAEFTESILPGMKRWEISFFSSQSSALRYVYCIHVNAL
jgi:hypothetical protein